MGFRQATNEWLSIIIKGMVIIVIVIGVLWFGLSVVGNVTQDNDGMPKAPKESKAAYQVTLHATGQNIYTDELTEIEPGRYELNGYYELINKKWVYRENVLNLDSYYFGDITVKER